MPAGVVRGCGKRQQGGAYLEVPVGPNGRPIEYFLCDPPHPIDQQATGASPVGVRLFPDPEKEAAPGVKLHHVLDWVGSESYPNVADVVEEVRRHGLSRRIAKTADFSGLGPGSRIYLAHSRALITNHAEHYEELAIAGRPHVCPKQLNQHDRFQPGECCAGLWWRDVEGGEWVVAGALRSYRRTVGDTTYACWPPLVEASRYQLGIFMILPLAQVAVIRAADGSHELTEHAASRGHLPVSLENE